LNISKKIGRYVKGKGLNLSEVCRQTGLNYQTIYASLYDENSDRDLRCEELIPLCVFLNVDPREFANADEK